MNTAVSGFDKDRSTRTHNSFKEAFREKVRQKMLAKSSAWKIISRFVNATPNPTVLKLQPHRVPARAGAENYVSQCTSYLKIKMAGPNMLED